MPREYPLIVKLPTRATRNQKGPRHPRPFPKSERWKAASSCAGTATVPGTWSLPTRLSLRIRIHFHLPNLERHGDLALAFTELLLVSIAHERAFDVDVIALPGALS